MQNPLKIFAVLAIFILHIACAQSPKTMTHKHTNSLVNETSPYLLQHAHNPVNWLPWGDAALAKAKAENKLILVSIGYSACHWCHVMEHETFEDSAAAELMNANYICIKVDREERPDIDNLYMGAVQLITGQGGWPLNCIALPDGRPIWGGTYFKKEDWMKSLRMVNELYQTDKERVLEYAANLESGLKQTDLVPAVLDKPAFTEADLQDAAENWKRRFDKKYGGPNKAPKFMLPNNYLYLLRYGWLSGDVAITEHVKLTLEQMAFGGIYDQIGGGFSRYSTDEYWKAPHFEKMLYDNAQLISLYSEAYKAYKNPLYKQVIEETIAFLQREMRGSENQFYAALDADSEGEEGKFYVWSETELKRLIAPKDWNLFEDYYNVNSAGRWEHGNYILLRRVGDDAFADKHNLPLEALQTMVLNWKKTLLKEREKHTRPGLDNKGLTAWNALTVKAFADAYLAFKNPEYLQQALQTAAFINTKLTKKDGTLWHTYSHGVAKIDAFLDDYATVIDAWLTLYQITGNPQWLRDAEKLTNHVLQNFDAGENALFYFAPANKQLLSRTVELSDNVLPASNSIMAHNLEKLGLYTEQASFRERAQKMAMQVKENMYSYGEGYSNWALLMLTWVYPSYEVAICGPKAEAVFNEFNAVYYPNLLYAWSEKKSDLPLLANRFTPAETLLYICQGNVCQLPTPNIKKAWTILKK